MKKKPSTFKVSKLLYFARSLGLRVKIGGDEGSYTPSNRNHEGTITIHVNARTLIAQPEEAAITVGRDIAHELGHYFVASKARRRRKDYGIPPGASTPYWEEDETKARLIEHCIRRCFGDTSAVKPETILRRRYMTRFSTNYRMNMKALKQWWKDIGQGLIDKELARDGKRPLIGSKR